MAKRRSKAAKPVKLVKSAKSAKAPKSVDALEHDEAKRRNRDLDPQLGLGQSSHIPLHCTAE